MIPGPVFPQPATPPASAPHAGWYAISQKPPILRWWTGSGWSDALVLRSAASHTRQSTATLLRRVTSITVGFWVLTGLWWALTIVMLISGGYGLLWFLAPVIFVAGSSVLEVRRSAYRRLLAADAPPPFGLAPVS